MDVWGAVLDVGFVAGAVLATCHQQLQVGPAGAPQGSVAPAFLSSGKGWGPSMLPALFSAVSMVVYGRKLSWGWCHSQTAESGMSEAAWIPAGS